VKPEIARGVRRLVPRRRRARGRPDSIDEPATTAAGWLPGAIDDPHLVFEANALDGADVAADRDPRIEPDGRRHRAAGWSSDRGEAFDPAEFAEFLEADDSPMPANPAFKERLRQQLWGMVRENADATPPPQLGDRPRRPRPAPKPKLPR
jgi:hypothetical protein